MKNLKELVRDEIVTKMSVHLDQTQTDMLNQVIVAVMFHVDVMESETLPATIDYSNEKIMEIWKWKKEPKIAVKTADYYRMTINHFIQFVNKSLLHVSDMDVECYLNWYWKVGFKGHGNSTATVNNERRNLSAFYSWMRKCHIVSDNPVDGVEPFSEIDKPIDYLAEWEMEELRDACIPKADKIVNMQEYKTKMRDRALIEFLRSTAMRVSECIPINREDINWTDGEVLIYGQKTRSYRVVCIDDVAQYHLKKYLACREDDESALFVGVRNVEKKAKRLSKNGIESAIRTLAKRSTLERRVYPHLFRKTTATNMVRKGCSRDLVAFYLGHKNGNTKTLNTHYAATDPAQVIGAFRKYGAAA